MIYSQLDDENMCYINIHAECALHTYSTEFAAEDNLDATRRTKGIYCNIVNSEILQKIYDSDFRYKDVCLDFDKIDVILDNNASGLINQLNEKFSSRNRTVYLINLSDKIFETLKVIEGVRVIGGDDGRRGIKVGSSPKNFSCKSLSEKEETLFINKLNDVIEDVADPFLSGDMHHSSVPVYLTKYVNIKKMIEYKTPFLQFAIYKLALKMIDSKIMSNSISGNMDTCLFFHTMNGAYIATQLAMLFQINFVYLDHLGPMGNIHRKHFERSISESCKYIIVSDVICLGGEVGRAKAIIEYNGGVVGCEACIVDIKTVKNQDVNNRISLYRISCDNNKIGYCIKTDLCNICERGDANG